MAPLPLPARVCGPGPRGGRGLGSQALPSAWSPHVRPPPPPGRRVWAASPPSPSPAQGTRHHAQGRASHLVTACRRPILDATVSRRPKQVGSDSFFHFFPIDR